MGVSVSLSVIVTCKSESNLFFPGGQIMRIRRGEKVWSRFMPLVWQSFGGVENHHTEWEGRPMRGTQGTGSIASVESSQPKGCVTCPERSFRSSSCSDRELSILLIRTARRFLAPPGSLPRVLHLPGPRRRVSWKAVSDPTRSGSLGPAWH